ncbi:caspase family protein [Kineococcus indalonis]|uniref:caspase family protein n=1 Tax=Kineococcus indalonis TaxID=2696566 RepID=UPI0014134696|nr:caspase family protein [Kineococcus indalonis]NAZ85034.1 caspase family protein [Kineococcus indalonis]
MAARALCIGIDDYPGTGSDLLGCVNDARDWGDALKARDFQVEELLDAEATGAALRERLRALVSGARSGDTVVVTFSGHGTWVPDEGGDEPDRRDEALCPYDVAARGPLLDDELFEVFTGRERGVRVVLVSDSCHSGSVARFQALPGGRARRLRFLPPEVFLPQEATRRARAVEGRAAGGSSRRSSALLLSGCQDHEFSYDGRFDGRPNGAFTHVALRALETLPGAATYRDWIAAVRAQLPSADHPQTPGLSGTSAQRSWRVLA